MRFRHNSRDAEDTGNGKHSGGSAAASDSNIQRRHALCRRGVTILEVQVITTADLKAQTRRELADLARNYGVPGWHGLKKDELVAMAADLELAVSGTKQDLAQRIIQHKAEAYDNETDRLEEVLYHTPEEAEASDSPS